jgi:hypothetical protein
MTLEMQDPKDVSIASTLKVEKDGVGPSSTEGDYLLRDNGDPTASEKEGPNQINGKRQYSIGTRVLKVKKCRYYLFSAISSQSVLSRAHCSLSPLLSALTALCGPREF